MIDPHELPTPGPASHGLRSLASRLSVATKSRQRRAQPDERPGASTSNGENGATGQNRENGGDLMRSTSSRREPRLKWPDDEHSPPSDFAPALSNAQLRAHDIPQRGDGWDLVSVFALSYDGNAYWDDLGALAHDTMQQWTRDRVLPRGLPELRASLFHEQRRWHHFGEEPRGRSGEYVWALVDAIADAL